MYHPAPSSLSAIINPLISSKITVGAYHDNFIFPNEKHLVVAYKDSISIYQVKSNGSLDSKLNDPSSQGLSLVVSIPFNSPESIICRIAPLRTSSITWIFIVFDNYFTQLINLNPCSIPSEENQKQPIIPISDIISKTSFFSSKIFLQNSTLLNKKTTTDHISRPNSSFTIHSENDPTIIPLPKELNPLIAIDQCSNLIAIWVQSNVINFLQFDLNISLHVKKFTHDRKRLIVYEKSMKNLNVKQVSQDMLKNSFRFFPNRLRIGGMLFIEHVARPMLVLLDYVSWEDTRLSVYQINLSNQSVELCAQPKSLDPNDCFSFILPNKTPIGGFFLLGTKKVILFKSPSFDSNSILSFEQNPNPLEPPEDKNDYRNKGKHNKKQKDKKLCYPQSLFVSEENCGVEDHIISYSHIDNDRILLGSSSGKIYILIAKNNLKTTRNLPEVQILIRYVGKYLPPLAVVYISSQTFFSACNISESALIEMKIIQSCNKKRRGNKNHHNNNNNNNRIHIDINDICYNIKIIQKLHTSTRIDSIEASAPHTKFQQFPIHDDQRPFYQDFLYLSCGADNHSYIKQLRPGLFTKEVNPEDATENFNSLPLNLEDQTTLFSLSNQGNAIISTPNNTFSYNIETESSLNSENQKLTGITDKTLIMEEPTLAITVYEKGIIQDSEVKYMLQITSKRVRISNYLSSKIIVEHFFSKQEIATCAAVDPHRPSFLLCLNNKVIKEISISNSIEFYCSNSLKASYTDQIPIQKMSLIDNTGILMSPLLYQGNLLKMIELHVPHSISQKRKKRAKINDEMKFVNISLNHITPSIDNSIMSMAFCKTPLSNLPNILFISTIDGRVIGLDTTFPKLDIVCQNFKPKVIFEIKLGNNGVTLFEPTNRRGFPFALIEGNVLMLFVTKNFKTSSSLGPQYSLTYIPLHLDFVPVLIIPPSYLANGSLKADKYNANYIFTSDWLSATITEQNKIRFIRIDSNKMFGYKAIIHKTSDTYYVLKIKLSPSHRYLVAFALKNKIDTDEDCYSLDLKNYTYRLIVYDTSTLTEVCRSEEYTGRFTFYDIFPFANEQFCETNTKKYTNMNCSEQFAVVLGSFDITTTEKIDTTKSKDGIKHCHYTKFWIFQEPDQLSLISQISNSNYPYMDIEQVRFFENSLLFISSDKVAQLKVKPFTYFKYLKTPSTELPPFVDNKIIDIPIERNGFNLMKPPFHKYTEFRDLAITDRETYNRRLGIIENIPSISLFSYSKFNNNLLHMSFKRFNRTVTMDINNGDNSNKLSGIPFYECLEFISPTVLIGGTTTGNIDLLEVREMEANNDLTRPPKEDLVLDKSLYIGESVTSCKNCKWPLVHYLKVMKFYENLNTHISSLSTTTTETTSPSFEGPTMSLIGTRQGSLLICYTEQQAEYESTIMRKIIENLEHAYSENANDGYDTFIIY